MKRRGFFQSLAKAAAIIALAPQLAFGVKPKVVGWDCGSITRARIHTLSPAELIQLFKPTADKLTEVEQAVWAEFEVKAIRAFEPIA